MTKVLTFTARDEQPKHPLSQSKPAMSWVIDRATGRPVMTWSLPQPVAESVAA